MSTRIERIAELAPLTGDVCDDCEWQGICKTDGICWWEARRVDAYARTAVAPPEPPPPVVTDSGDRARRRTHPETGGRIGGS